MSNQDTLSDALTRVRNAQLVGHKYTILPSSSLVINSLKVLHDEGYIESFEVFQERKGINFVKVDLKYYRGEPVISKIKRVSKPGRRVYSKIDKLKVSYRGLGIKVLSTSAGVISDRKAKESKLGGEVLFEVF